MTLQKNKLMKIKRTPMLNNNKQQLNHIQCENMDEIGKCQEDNLISKEDSTENAR